MSIAVTDEIKAGFWFIVKLLGRDTSFCAITKRKGVVCLLIRRLGGMLPNICSS